VHAVPFFDQSLSIKVSSSSDHHTSSLAKSVECISILQATHPNPPSYALSRYQNPNRQQSCHVYIIHIILPTDLCLDWSYLEFRVSVKSQSPFSLKWSLALSSCEKHRKSLLNSKSPKQITSAQDYLYLHDLHNLLFLAYSLILQFNSYVNLCFSLENQQLFSDKRQHAPFHENLSRTECISKNS